MSKYKNALLILGSPRRKKSGSYHLGISFAEGLKRAGVTVKEIIITDQKIKHCIGCYTCWTKTPGKCIHRDDMDILLAEINKVDLNVYAFPLYVFNVPGIVKDFLDRQLPLLKPYLVEKEGITSHPRRIKSEKTGFFLISVAGFPELSHFDALIDMFKKRAIPGNEIYIGDILLTGAENMSKERFQDGYKELYKLVEQAGFEVATNGVVSKRINELIIEESIKPENIKNFNEVANKYWDTFKPIDYNQIKIKKQPKIKPLKLSDGGMGSYLAGMAKQYKPNVIPGLRAVIQFDFDNDFYHLIIEETECTAYKGSYPNPTTTIISPPEVWMKIGTGELDAPKSMVEGLYKVEGDLKILLKMDQMFLDKELSKTISSDKTEDSVEMKKERFEKIQEHRGPIKMNGQLWLTIAFTPWIIVWVLSALSAFIPELFTFIIAFSISLLIIIYHFTTNRPTLFELATCIYLAISVFLFVLNIEFFLVYNSVLNFIFLGGLWLGSNLKYFSLTSEYIRLDYPKVLWDNAAFLETNKILSIVWGLYFLFAATLGLVIIANNALKIPLIIITYVLLCPMFIFTSWFQKWYPEKKG